MVKLLASNNKLLLSSNSKLLQYSIEGKKVSLTVNAETGSLITITKGTTSLTGISVDGKYTFILPEMGTWTIFTEKDGSGSATKTIEIRDNYSVSLSYIGELNDSEWGVIKSISDAGEAANYWSVGDCKAVTLNGTVGSCTFSNETYYAFIIGFDHNSTYEGSNRIHFQFGKTALTGGIDICFVDSSYASAGSTAAFRMNTTNTNVGGWSSSYMRNTICGDIVYVGSNFTPVYTGFLGVLPSELQSVLKSVTKYTDNTGNSSTAAANVTATTDYIFLLAEYEVFGSIFIANSNESSKQAQYAYYAAGNSYIKYRHSATNSAPSWWLRSPYTGSAVDFVSAYSGGEVSYNADRSFCFAPGFCV